MKDCRGRVSLTSGRMSSIESKFMRTSALSVAGVSARADSGSKAVASEAAAATENCKKWRRSHLGVVADDAAGVAFMRHGVGTNAVGGMRDVR